MRLINNSNRKKYLTDVYILWVNEIYFVCWTAVYAVYAIKYRNTCISITQKYCFKKKHKFNLYAPLNDGLAKIYHTQCL